MIKPKEMKKVNKRRLSGVVVSVKMAKTVLVKVDRLVGHPKYQKFYIVSTKYVADSGSFALALDDKVTIEACRPLSKTKRWRVIKKI